MYSHSLFRPLAYCLFLANRNNILGIIVKGHTLKVRRPNDYNPAMCAPCIATPLLPDVVAELKGQGAGGADMASTGQSPHTLFIGGLPYNLVTDQVSLIPS